MLIQYTLYNRLIVWEPFPLRFHSQRIPDTSWLQVRKEESKKWNWNTFTQFVKQYLKTKEREKTLSSITLSSALWNGVGGGGGGWGGAVSGDQLTEPVPLSIMWMRCHAPNSKPWNSKATIFQIHLLFLNPFYILLFFPLVSFFSCFVRKHLNIRIFLSRTTSRFKKIISDHGFFFSSVKRNAHSD